MRKQIPYGLSGILIICILVLAVHANTLPFVPFEPTDPASLTGDVNGDGSVDEQDILCLQQYFAGGAVPLRTTLADVDNDGEVTRRDAMILARYLAQWEGYTLPYKQ
ncbi:MAG: hypothetical protein II979_06200 [Clostridia bacterium]|nr:hypothetical protein [Clostridia bacterium]